VIGFVLQEMRDRRGGTVAQAMVVVREREARGGFVPPRPADRSKAAAAAHRCARSMGCTKSACVGVAAK